jgi:hypothetical protein
VTVAQFILAWTIAGAAAIAVFPHAERHRVGHSTASGIGVFLVLGLALPLYVIHYRQQRDRRRY